MKWAYKTVFLDPYELPSSDEKNTGLSAEEFKRAVMKIFEPPKFEADLNTLGQDGWELVSVVPGKISDDGRPWTAIFKKPID